MLRHKSESDQRSFKQAMASVHRERDGLADKLAATEQALDAKDKDLRCAHDTSVCDTPVVAL